MATGGVKVRAAGREQHCLISGGPPCCRETGKRAGLKLSNTISLIALFAAAIVMAAEPQALTQQQERQWEEPATLCGVSFSIIRKEWVVLPEPPQSGLGVCGGSLRSRRYEAFMKSGSAGHHWNIAIDVYPQPLDELMELFDIVQEGNRWFMGEGARQQPAYEITGPGWWGLRVDEASFRSGAIDAQGRTFTFEAGGVRIVITSKESKRTVEIIEGDGAEQALALLLNTFKFDKTR